MEKEFKDQDEARLKDTYPRKNFSGEVRVANVPNVPNQLSTEAWQVAVNTRHLQTTEATAHALSRLCRWSLPKGPVRSSESSGGNYKLHQPQKHPGGSFPASPELSEGRIGFKYDAEASHNRKLRLAQY